MAEMKESYAGGGYGGGKSGGAYGSGGLKAATSRNPNKHSSLNEAPCGPYPHYLGYSDDGGMQGDTSCEHRGGTYYFK